MRSVRGHAAKVGASVEVAEPYLGVRAVTIDAPSGMLWIASGCHCICGATFDAADLLVQMRYGLAPCVEPDCDVCQGE